MSNYRTIIKDLVKNLPPRVRESSPAQLWGLWLAAALVVSTSITLYIQPLRPTLNTDLTSLRFTFELLFGIAALGTGALCTVLMGYPDSVNSRVLRYLPIFMTAAWVLVIAGGIYAPSTDVSMVGKRPYCFYEGIAYGATGLLLFSLLSYRLAYLRPRLSCMVMGMVATIIPALLMHVGCMYHPVHIAEAHLSPIGIVAMCGFVLAPLLLYSPFRKRK